MSSKKAGYSDEGATGMNLIKKLAVIIVALGSVSVAQADVIEIDWASVGGDSDFSVQQVFFDPIEVDSFISLETNGYLENLVDASDSSIAAVIFLYLGDEWVLFAQDYSVTGPAGNYVLDGFGFLDVDFGSGLLGGISITSSHSPTTVYHNMRPGTVFTFGVTSVPEPATLALFGLGLAGIGLARRRRQQG